MIAALLVALAAPADTDLAERYFQEARWACEDDGGKLWGVNLWGPLVFVDRQTRAVYANEPGPGLSEQNGVWTGTLPDSIGIANTAFEWEGKRWTMVMWPLPQNRGERVRLITHELYHRIQPELGLDGPSEPSEHLDTEPGRLWLQLEGRALAIALQDIGERGDQAMRDALLFRAKRQSLFEGAKDREDRLELNEGLAEYTGFMLYGAWEPEARLWLGRQMEVNFDNRDSYARSFCYRTGPAYAFLINLNEALTGNGPEWRSKVTLETSLAGLLAAKLDFTPELGTAEARAGEYGYAELLAQEKARTAERLAKTKAFTARFVEGPRLEIPFNGGQISFDPGNVFSLGEHGTVYPGATLIHELGTLTAPGGVLMAPDFSRAWVNAPASLSSLEGEGWTLKLNAGWKLVAGERSGDFKIARAQ